jgi:hypothetical protein
VADVSQGVGRMAKIDSFNFGFIVVDDKQYDHDIIILPDGTVKERHAGRGRLGSHTISRDEILSLTREQPDSILIGTGVHGMAKVARDAEFFLTDPQYDIAALPTPDAVKKFNQLIEDGEKVAALIHITC